MKILLNLLPLENRTVVRRVDRSRLLVAEGMGILLIGAMFCGILIGVSAMLSIRLDSIRAETNTSDIKQGINREVMDTSEETFRSINEKTKEISRLLDGHVSWEKFLQSIGEATPEGVFYTNLVSRKNFTFSVSGVASDRDALVALEKAVSASDCFREASIPLSDKLEKTNIDFQLDAVIEEACIFTKVSS